MPSSPAAALPGFDTWLEESIGAGQVARLRATLTAIADAENPVRNAPPIASEAQAERRRPARARR